MAGRGQGRSRKDKRPIDHDDGATPSLPSTPHLHPSFADGRQQSFRHRSIPPHSSTHYTTHHSPAQQYYHHSPPQDYTPLPPHDPTSSYMGASSHQSQSHVVRPSSAPFASSPAGSHPSRFQPAGSQQGSRSMQGFIPNHQVTKIITDILGGLYNAPYLTWSDFPEDLVQQMFNQFKTKCAWEDRYNREICANWEYKCRKRFSDSFCSARKVNKKPSWVLPDLWEDLQRYWATEKFEKQSELGKKARESEKGGSLHCLGSRSMWDTRRQLEKNMGGR
ncbi:uncharacterized protein LOC142168046 [Nicotiana tabacum]|uniref:Uncharacterized protein LOC142168046 n=1 Tax=Nicotiana tabacum TaxID=4097 RepID=A0AC58SIK1_TOBAC